MSDNEEYSPLNIPSHGNVPRWLQDIADNVTNNYKTSPMKEPHRRSSLSPDQTESPEIPGSIEKLTISRPSSSARYGRRASVTSQINALASPTDVELSKSEYFLPKFDEPHDFSTMDDDQASLEKSWKSLILFQKSHKGRLDSAKVEDEQPKLGDYFESSLTPVSSISSRSNSDTEKGYSPSMMDKTVPSRSQSEMSSYLPQYLYSNVPSGVEIPGNILSKTMNNFNNISKSTENIFPNSFKNSQIDQKDQPVNKLNGYKMQVAKENQLRQQIINELLLENERIASQISDTGARVIRSPSLSDISNQSVFSNGSKHKQSRKVKEVQSSPEESFIIPELPSGTVLAVEILSTWGDKYYVGLNGIEIFGDDGKIVKVKKIRANPADVNVLPECHNDPRIAPNILDGVNRTQDDVHLWLAPFTIGETHTITMEFSEPAVISMIRIWNYNKSRIHSYRGVRNIIITLDGEPIFVGEIAKACGGIIGGVDAFGDTILFTVNEDILELISLNDHSYPTLMSANLDSPIKSEERPSTSAFTISAGVRPFTGLPTDLSSADDQVLLGAKRLEIILVSNWGFANVIGLSGIELIQGTDSIIPIAEDNIICDSRAKRVMLNRLFNGDNVTTDNSNMWYTRYKYGEHYVLTLEFENFVYISGLRIWNYNASLELTYAGVSRLKILLDGHAIANPVTKDDFFVLRRAPGNIHYDFVQEIFLGDSNSIVHKVEMNPSFIISGSHTEEAYENPWMPEGFVFQIIIFSTWGDQYYCGLNGLELYDFKGRKIYLEESNICAYPESINVLPDVTGDVRTPDKLIDNVNESNDGLHAWLAPIIPKCLNRIYIVLDQPITVSVIKLWNYSKTPTRGVKEFGVLVDDLLVYNGILDKYSSHDGSKKYRTILFTDDMNVIERESANLVRRNGDYDGFPFEGSTRTTTGGSLPNADQSLRPFTAVSPFNRGCTSQSH